MTEYIRGLWHKHKLEDKDGYCGGVDPDAFIAALEEYAEAQRQSSAYAYRKRTESRQISQGSDTTVLTPEDIDGDMEAILDARVEEAK